MSESVSLAHNMLASINFTNAWSIYYKSVCGPMIESLNNKVMDFIIL